MMRHRVPFVFLSMIVLLAVSAADTPAGAQGVPPDPDYEYSLPQAFGQQGDLVTVPVTVTNSGLPILGWSMSVCHNPGEVTLQGAQPTPTLNTMNGGQPVDFFLIELLPDAVTLGIVVDFFGINNMPQGIFEVLDIDYLLDGPPNTLAILEFCAAGNPAVENIVVIGGGLGVTPVTINGSINYGGTPGPGFVYTVPSATVGFASGVGVADFTVGATILENTDVTPIDTFGFSMGLAHDPVYLESTAVSPTPFLSTLNAGAGPEFFGPNLLLNGTTLGVVYSLTDPTQILVYDPVQEVATIDYQTNSGTLQGVLQPVETVLDWTNTLGNPTVSNLVVISTSGTTVPPLLVNGTITLVPGGAIFVRGDCTGEGLYDIGDPVGLLGSLFAGTGPLACDDACDANDDGNLDVGDGVYMLNNLFLSGPPPAGPFPVCGVDQTDDNLDCDSFNACP
ncbi:MAG: hypothetical protein ACE5GW_02175 [Planctomycetota bacterium]